MKKSKKYQFLVRDISWLSFNERVLQEAKDITVPLAERLRFLGIFSNNLDEFFRVRVATLNRMRRFEGNAKSFLHEKPSAILKRIQIIVQKQQQEFEKIYQDILAEMRKQDIYMVSEKKLNKEQQLFVEDYFNEKVRTNIAPLIISDERGLTSLQDKSIYMACILRNTSKQLQQYALIEIPTKVLPRFVILPSSGRKKTIILLEDIIRFCLPKLFMQFGFDEYESYIIKVTKDAELDIDYDVNTDVIASLEKGLKNRRKAKAVRLVYDKSIPKEFLDHLISLLKLIRSDHLVSGGRIHNFKDFMNFPFEVFQKRSYRKKPFVHPLLTQPLRIMEVLDKRDVMLHFPYHSFDSMIDLLREAAIDPNVISIKITAYRMAKDSKIMNALLNAKRNGKHVTVAIELKARFDEEANLQWKRILEEEGIKVLVGLPDKKIHAKICVIQRRVGKHKKGYGFVSTGNLNENTAKIYCDHVLLTTNKKIIQDIERVFHFIQNPELVRHIHHCRTLIVSPHHTRNFFTKQLNQLHKPTKKHPENGCTLKMNSLTDHGMMTKIYQLAEQQIPVHLIVRGICCAVTESKFWEKPIEALSIVDEYLEHARIFWFRNNGKEDFFISSADWMMRNLDYRIEVTVPIFNTELKEELKTILQLQLKENVKARRLNNGMSNEYLVRLPGVKPLRSQLAIYEFLRKKTY